MLGSVEETRKHLVFNFKDARELLTRVEFNYEGKIRVPGLKALADLPNLQCLQVNIKGYATLGSRSHDLFRVYGLKQLKAIRGCKEVVVTCEKGPPSAPDWKYFEDSHVEQFENMLRKELCKPRGTK
jgi:hypothetical protein